MLRQCLLWRALRTFAKKTEAKPVKKCQLRKKLKLGFKEYLLEHVDAFRMGLSNNSLKYAVWFGHNMSLAAPADRMHFKDIKRAIRRSIQQLDGEMCIRISDILANYKCNEDEEDIIEQLKKYVEENLEEFEERDLKKFEDNLYLINHESLPFARITPKLEPSRHQQSFVKKQIQKAGVDTTPFSYSFEQHHYKLTLNTDGKVLKIVGIGHSIEWIENMRSELDKCQGLIMELVPFYHEEKTEATPEEDYDAKLRRIMGTIKGVREVVVEKRQLNTPFVLRDVPRYLKHFPTNGSMVLHKNDKGQLEEVDELRTLLKYLPSSVDSVLLGDITIEEEIIELAQRYSLEQIKEFYAFLRLLYINEQGRYLQQISKSGCLQCGGSAELITPLNIADERYYPLDLRQQFMANNIHHYIKSTPYSHYSCFVGEDHVFPLFKHLSDLYKDDRGWKVDRDLHNLEMFRPRYRLEPQTQSERQVEVNKIALLSSLYPRGLSQLPLQLREMQPLHDQLLQKYRELLHPFPVRCRS